jgi:prepilin-type N-terminal cleavage/methylation domain-containing protein
MLERYRKIQMEKASGERESGFTLIELLIVIVVMGILAAVVIFALSGVSSSSAVSACNTDAKTVQTAVQAYIAQGNTAASATQANLSPAYIHTWPSSTSYSITLDATTAGQVDVTVPVAHGGTGIATNYDTTSGSPPVNVCSSITK